MSRSSRSSLPRFRAGLATAAVLGGASGAFAAGSAPAGATEPGQDGKLAITMGNSGVWIANPDGSQSSTLQYSGGNAVNGAWSPDGRWLASMNDAGWAGLVISHPDGSSAITIHQGMAFASFDAPTWYDGGAGVAFANHPGDDASAPTQIFGVAPNASATPSLLVPPPSATGSAAGASCGDSAPNGLGHLIAFQRSVRDAQGVCGPAAVWIFDTVTHTESKILDDASEPNLAPDGKHLSFTRTTGTSITTPQIFTAALDGSGVSQLTTCASGCTASAWSPSGTRIAYIDPGKVDIQDVASHSVSSLTAPSSYISFLSWQPVVPGPPAGGAPGAMAYMQDGSLFTTAHNGPIATRVDYRPAWTPNGNRLIYGSANSGLVSIAPDGSGLVNVTSAHDDRNPAVDPSGSFVVFSRGGQLYLAATDGSSAGYEAAVRGTAPAAGGGDDFPTISPDGTIAYQHSANGSSDVWRVLDGSAGALISNAAQPAYSPDGSRIAFVRKDGNGVQQIFTVGADGRSGLSQITNETYGATMPAWSADGSKIAYTQPLSHATVQIRATGGGALATVDNADNAVWQPAGSAHVLRQWGADRIGTAIAASQYDFARAGDTGDRARSQAGAVVLSRSDAYADALAGSALAVRKNAPLLITPPTGLSSAVAGEMRRVLAPGGTVYLLGGTSALSPQVEAAVKAMHYTVVRLSGPERFATSVAIAKAIDAHPKTVLIATGTNFPDALSAGATGEPLVLTDGATMPKATAGYLNGLNPAGAAHGGTDLVTIGGPGDAALIAGYRAKQMPNWPTSISRLPLIGANRFDTSTYVAHTFFGAENEAAVATGLAWPDALSGGAMIGHLGGPLLLSAPSGLSWRNASYLAQENGSLWAVDVLGGPSALPNSLLGQIAAAAGAPGHGAVVGDEGAGGASGAARAGAGAGAGTGAGTGTEAGPAGGAERRGGAGSGLSGELAGAKVVVSEF